MVWRLDRLGRTAKGLVNLFEDIQARKVNLVSVRDGLDLSTPAGRLMAIGALAVGAMTVRRLRILEARIETLSIGQLTVDHLHVRSQSAT